MTLFERADPTLKGHLRVAHRHRRPVIIVVQRKVLIKAERLARFSKSGLRRHRLHRRVKPVLTYDAGGLFIRARQILQETPPTRVIVRRPQEIVGLLGCFTAWRSDLEVLASPFVLVELRRQVLALGRGCALGRTFHLHHPTAVALRQLQVLLLVGASLPVLHFDRLCKVLGLLFNLLLLKRLRMPRCSCSVGREPDFVAS